MSYRFEYDKTHGILRTCMEGVIGDDEIARFRVEIAKIVSDLHPRACIVDLSDTKQYDISSENIRMIGRAAPALPGMSIPVILVAPAIHIFGSSRMFQIVSEEKRPWIRVVRSCDEAYQSLEVEPPNFGPLPSSE